MADSEQKTYRSKAGCSNCGNAGAVYEIPLGTEVRKVKCAHCGCAGYLYRIDDAVGQPVADVTRPRPGLVQG